MAMDTFLIIPSATVLAANATFEEYLDLYAADFAEWLDGVVIKMSPVTRRHDLLGRWFALLFTAYLERTDEGELLQAPMVMKLSDKKRGREPDLQIVLVAHVDRIKDTYVDGPADLVVEIVSEESMERDRGAKFKEYEQDGVPEYWIVDYIHKESLFYVLNAAGVYESHLPDENGIYHSTVLSHLQLPVALLWQDPLPTMQDIISMVEKMLE